VRCHGIVVEPLRLRRVDYHMRGTNGGLRVSRGRSSCIHDVRWLQGQTVVELHDEVSLRQYDDNSMVLERFEVGMWEVESSRPSWSLSPWLARLIVTEDTPDLRVRLERLAPASRPFRGWYLGERTDRCR